MAAASLRRDLDGVRVVVPQAPAEWFGGYDLRAGEVMTACLEERGAQVFRFPVRPILFDEPPSVLATQIAELKAFRPQVAVGIPNAGYALACRAPSAGGSANIFTDILEIPVILLWDHGLFQFPSLLLGGLPDDSRRSQPGALATLKRQINHPLLRHFPLDHGQVRVMRELGILDETGVVRVTPAMTQPPFVRYGLDNPAPDRFDEDVCFAGNVYRNRMQELDYRRLPAFAAIEAEVVAAKLADLRRPVWPLFIEAITRLPEADRVRYNLDPDQSFFWRMAHDLIQQVVNTEIRMALLSAIARPVSFYGGFADPGSVDALAQLPRVTFKGSVDFHDGLPRLYARSRLHVDFVNTGFITAPSSKAMNCFAAGGFSLLDEKADFVALAGDAAGHISFVDFDDMNGKIDLYLSNPRRREEVRRHFQDMARRLDYVDVWCDAILGAVGRAG